MANTRDNGVVIDFREELIVACCRELLNAALNSEQGLEAWDDNAAFAQRLFAEFGPKTVEDYRLFHVMAGSTLIQPCPLFDFPAEYSVKNHLLRLAETYAPDTYRLIIISKKLRGVP